MDLDVQSDVSRVFVMHDGEWGGAVVGPKQFNNPAPHPATIIVEMSQIQNICVHPIFGVYRSAMCARSSA